MIGEIYLKRDGTNVSHYQPSKEITDVTSYVKKDFSYGNEILNKSWVELNNKSVIQDMNIGQKSFNAFVDESVEDPSQAWKWRGTRSKARNKAIALHAQLTAGYIVPMFMAQNENDEEDRDFSNFMRDIVEWMVDNSNYKSSYLMTTMGMLMNPVTYMGAEYAEIYQTIKQRTEQGIQKKEILDEVLSGFRAPVYSADQILISNVYEQNIQKQRCIIKRRYIDYTEAKAKYGSHPNWEHVKMGRQTLYNDEDGLFYEIKDEDHPSLVEETIYYSRRDDSEIPFVGGIYMGDIDDVEANPIAHRNHTGSPMYNVVPFGYQRITEHFFYYKSLMNSMQWDDKLIDAQYEILMNRAFLDTNMPIAVSGTDKVDTEVIFPSAVIAFQDKDTRITPLLPQSNLSSMASAFRITEESMDEASLSDTSAGQLPQASQTATSVALANRNAQIMLQGVGKTLALSVVQYGNLMADIGVNHLSLPQVDNILGMEGKLKYRTFILNNKQVNGKEVTKVIKFDESLLGMRMTEKEIENRNVALLKQIGYPENKKHLYLINPELFARRKYLTRVEPERMFPKNEEYTQALYSQIYAQLRNDPLVSGEALVRKVLHAFFRGESEDLIAKQQPTMDSAQGILGANPPQTPMGQQAVNGASANALAGVGLA